MSYSFDDHRFRFAIWTSARASQRGLKNASVDNLAKIINEINIVNSINPDDFINEKSFDEFHKIICNEILKKGKNLNIDFKYGRAAKLLAIFIKTYYVLPEKGKGDISKFAHPPIDRIVLENLKKDGKIKAVPAWTTLCEKDYFNLINEIRNNSEIEYFWELEDNWKV